MLAFYILTAPPNNCSATGFICTIQPSFQYHNPIRNAHVISHAFIDDIQLQIAGMHAHLNIMAATADTTIPKVCYFCKDRILRTQSFAPVHKNRAAEQVQE